MAVARGFVVRPPVSRVLWARWAYGRRAPEPLARRLSRPKEGTFAALLYDTLVAGDPVDTRSYPPKAPRAVGNTLLRVAETHGLALARPAPFIYLFTNPAPILVIEVIVEIFDLP